MPSLATEIVRSWVRFPPPVRPVPVAMVRVGGTFMAAMTWESCTL
jgi:hypothetical protein